EIQAVREYGNFVGASVGIGVLQNLDAVSRHLAGFRTQRVLIEFHHPQTPSFVPCHGHRIDHFRLASEQSDFEARRDREFFLRVLRGKCERGRWRMRTTELASGCFVFVDREIVRLSSRRGGYFGEGSAKNKRPGDAKPGEGLPGCNKERI